MNLIELYDKLELPEEGNEKTFTAIPIPEHPSFRIAINFEGNPVLLLSVANGIKGNVLKNFRLKYLQLEQNVECKITEQLMSSFKTFTVVTFTSGDRNLQEYFLRISETLIKTLSSNPTQKQIIDSINTFVEVFRSLVDTPTNTVHGLWAELFLIESCKSPKTLLNFWHNLLTEKFDFNSGVEKIEVKSNSNFERIHTFSSEQLSPPAGSLVLIASVFIRQHSNGQNIQQLIESICKKIEGNIDLAGKLNYIISKTLGNSLEQSIKIKFDYNIAKESLQFYKHQDIVKIEEVHIPNKVSEVRYKTDMSEITPLHLSELKKGAELFLAI